MPMLKLLPIVAVPLGFLALAVAAQTNPPHDATLLQGKQALGDWHQDRPGLRRLLQPQDLPAIGRSTPAFAQIVPIPQGARPQVPQGFRIDLVASGFRDPRAIRTAPNGDLFLADSMAGAVHVLRLPPGSATPVENKIYADGLFQPFGMAFYPPGPNPRWLYVADSDGIVRFPYHNGDLAAGGTPAKIVERIPWVHHWTRDIAFTPDGAQLLLAVGSGSNVALDMFPQPLTKGGLAEWVRTHPVGAAWDTEERRADLLVYDPDGRNERIAATGLRNCAGLTIQPKTGQPWCVVNERDELGDDTPFEYATPVRAGAFYGWPWYYLGGHEDPRHPGARPDLKDKVAMPAVLMQAHTAPLQIVFYQGADFPPDYAGSAFVTMHGSWNRAHRAGYKLVRLLFDQAGRPTGEVEDFMTGMVVSDQAVWGRPVGVTVAYDGSLIVTEDGNGTVWRITHRPVGVSQAPRIP
jgi:glucose/arabinose dehydrogenase